MENELPLVSVCVITYNHEPYIIDCLAGIAKQKTDFRFEIIIHDDASTDNTQELIKKFHNSGPGIIRTVFQEKNQFSQGVKIWPQIVFPMAKGKYIALCEGDDYWTDPNKLQKQFDFLEENKEYGVVFTDTHILNQSTGEIVRNYDSTFKRKVPTGDVLATLIEGNPYRTCTAMFQCELLKDYLSVVLCLHILKVGDVPLWIHIASKKKVGYIKESMAVYRVLESSASNFTTLAQCIAFEKGKYKMKLYLVSLFDIPFDRKRQKKKVRRNIIRYRIAKNQYKGLDRPWNDIGMVFSLIIKEKFVKPVIKLLPATN